MKINRIDLAENLRPVAPGLLGTSAPTTPPNPGPTGMVELDAGLTVLQGLAPAERRCIRDAFRALGGERGLGVRGVLEVNGVFLHLDDDTVEQLELGLPAAPILVLGSGMPAVVRPSDVGDAREQLRSLQDERTLLAHEMDDARSELDPFAPAALEVVLGQIDALEMQRQSVRSRISQQGDDQRRHLEERRTAVEDLDRWVMAINGLGDTLDSLAELLDSSSGSGPHDFGRTATQLADHLDSSLTELQRQLDQRAGVRETLDELQDRIDSAAQHMQGHTSTQHDPELVGRLEAVRDEIFAVDDKGVRLRPTRDKRLLTELRAEEAVLLDHLGYDTYSSYVMGIPNARSEQQRWEQLVEAEAALERLKDERDLVAAEAPDEEELALCAARFLTALDEAETMVSAPSQLPDLNELLDGAVIDPVTFDRSVRAAEMLRSHGVRAESDGRAVAEAVRGVMSELHDGWRSAIVTAADLVSVVPEPPGAHADDPAEVMELGHAWVAWYQQCVQELDRRTEMVSTMPDSAPPETDVRAEWARVEAELDAALDRLAETRERLAGHEAASERVAGLRERELAVRDTERQLMSVISGTEIVAPADPAVEVLEAGERPPPGTAADAEWAAIEFLAPLVSASFVGAVPALVDGLPESSSARAAVLQRLEEMAELIQVVVLDDASLATT